MTTSEAILLVLGCLTSSIIVGIWIYLLFIYLKSCFLKEPTLKNYLCVKFKRELIFYKPISLSLILFFSFLGFFVMLIWILNQNINNLVLGFQIFGWALVPLKIVIKIVNSFISKRKIEDYNSDLIPVYDQKTFEKMNEQLQNINKIIEDSSKDSSFYQDQERKRKNYERNIKMFKDFIEIRETKTMKIKIKHPRIYKLFY